MDDNAGLDRASLRQRLLEQARTILKSEELTTQDHFMDAGGDSLMAPVLAKRIEAEFGVRPELEDIFTKSFGELADLIAALQDPSGR